ncbi:NADH:ubiquinone reductase (Na(+)-transporting) subunit D [Reichenbachiella agarivorans]|uniref:NADH:ubiquinone reductase (Na(+)-transporting) subunit D n=1 Tax=Reichenbachiella agarivorans TaxID=2979464 RepID=A0ABY6CVK6_9BACT|nr:NADH:ubiquinone reductase (Na(+)-transporting) subunit D [Reichenbachiella agarivorans]UXP33503.1 NADH:ubiquinone reductase (Na(+)-transporting) subunit D [Reichenbachiella agarivorans]
MSTETLEQAIVKEPSEPLFSKRRKKFITDPLNDDNPITIQVLGICSALAVTVKMQPTLVMSIAVVFVVVFSNLIISLMRNIIPGRIRIIVQLAIVATLVTLVSEFLKAYLFDMYKVLGAFVGLIITNCIVMGRLEAFAMANKAYDSVLDGLGSGFGYAWIILTVAFFRELLGSGSVFDFPVYGTIQNLTGFAIPTNGLMVDSIGAFMVLGIIIWIQRTKNGYVEH